MSTVKLATLRAVFVDGSLDDNGHVAANLAYQPLTLPQYSAGYIDIYCVGSDGEAFNISAITLLLGVRHHGTDAAPAISLQATNVDGPAGLARFELIPGHWLDVSPKLYRYDVVAVVSENDRFEVVPSSDFRCTDENVHPGDDVQVPDSLQPMAQGEPGPPGDPALVDDIQPLGLAAAAGDDDTYARGDHVHADRTIPGVAGSWTNVSVTVDATGRITAIENGAAGGNTSVGDDLLGGSSEGGSWLWEDSASGGFDDFFAYDPNLADGNQVYAMGVKTYTNATDPRDNPVWSAGWNYGAGGAFDTTKGALGESREQYYERGGGFPTQMEHYMAFRPPDATGQPSLRYFAFNGRLGDPYSTELFLTSAQVTLGTILNPNLMILDEGGPGDNGSFQVQSLNGHSTLKINDAVCEFIVSNGSTTRTIEFGYPISTIGTELRQIGLMRFFGDIQNNKASNEVLTVGAAGAAAPLPATPEGFLLFTLSTDDVVEIPYFKRAP